MQPVNPKPGVPEGQFASGQRLIIFAKNQPQYMRLPAVVEADGDLVTTKWKLSWAERLEVLLTGSLFLQVRTFGRPLQPLKPSVYAPSELE